MLIQCALTPTKQRYLPADNGTQNNKINFLVGFATIFPLMRDDFKKVINNTMKFKTISIADSETLIKEAKPLILDCRDLKDYKSGHLDDALHVHEGLKESLVKRGDKQRSLLIYCYYGHASEHLAEFFSDFGFKDVYSLEGGYSGWKEKHQEA